MLLASLVLLFVSMAARAFASNVSVLLLTTAGVGGGIAIAGTLFAGIIKARFPRKVAMMMSVYATSLAFSTTVSAAATGPIAAFAGEQRMAAWNRDLVSDRADWGFRRACNPCVGKAGVLGCQRPARRRCAITAEEPDSVAGRNVFRLRQCFVLCIAVLDFADIS